MLADVLTDNRLNKLKALLSVISEEIDKKPGARDLAGLAKQYRETIKEIEEIEGDTTETDEIAEILKKRDDNGQSRAVRKNRTKVHSD